MISTLQQHVNRKKAVLDNQSLELKPYPDVLVREEILRKKEGQIFKISGTLKYVYAFAMIPSLNWYYLEKVELRNFLNNVQ